MGQVDNISNRFRLSRRIIVGIILVVVIATATVFYVYNSMSMASVTSIALGQIQAVRIFTSGTYPNRNATYIIEVQVWSKARALDVSLGTPIFLADADRVPLGNQTLGGGTILRGAYLTYDLRFNINESKAIVTFSGSGNDITVNMVSLVQAGSFSRTVTLSTGAVWNWTTATLILNGGCFDITFSTNC
jgi:hypothetical protein